MKNFDDEKIKYPLSDEKFTNKGDIEYPLITDLVNIKVLNNNTKLLNEKIDTTKSDINNNLQNVARESSPKYIENQVRKLDSIKNEIVNSVQTTIINNSGDGNFLNLPNLTYKELGILPQSNSYKELLSINRAGYLCGALCMCMLTAKSLHGIKIIVDGKTIIWQEINAKNLNRNITKYGYCGIANVQNQVDFVKDYLDYEGKFLGGFKIGVNYILRNQDGYPIGEFSSNRRYVDANTLPTQGTNYGVTLAKIICSKGIRFERSLRIEYMAENSETKITYLYSLDD